MDRKPSDAELGPQLLRQFSHGALGRYLLLPGDPDRVATLASGWEDAELIALERGFRVGRGVIGGAPIAALSTGIGGGSLEIALVEAAELGVDTFIRVGTTAALVESIQCGDLVINEASVRLDAASASYVQPEYPAAACYEVTLALIEAAERDRDAPYHVGVGATTASFFAGQERPGFAGYRAAATRGLLGQLARARVINVEMEAATLFTLSRVFGLRAGAVCSVIAHRTTGAWRDAGGIERACRVASRAVRVLGDWDEAKRAAGARWLCPGLLRSGEPTDPAT